MTEVKQIELPQSQQQNLQQQNQQQIQQQRQEDQQQQVQQQQVQQQIQQGQQEVRQQQEQQPGNGSHRFVPTRVQFQPQAVAASMPQQLQGVVTVSMQQQQQQQQGVSMRFAGQQGATTITTMAAHPQEVPIIQQPMQSQAYDLQQLYNTLGQSLLIPRNIGFHPAGLSPSSIQYTMCTAETAAGARSEGTQFTPWQFAQQVAWTGLHSPALHTAASNQIFIGGPMQQDMFIPSPQPIQMHNTLAAQQRIHGIQQIASVGGQPRVMDLQQQQQQQQQRSKQAGGRRRGRPRSIRPSLVQGVHSQNIGQVSFRGQQLIMPCKQQQLQLQQEYQQQLQQQQQQLESRKALNKEETTGIINRVEITVTQTNNPEVKCSENDDALGIVPKQKGGGCSNPSAGLANAINSIADGVSSEETSMPTPIVPTVTNKQAPPKAMVRPQVLSHVIQGFVIKEASEPFGINQSSLSGTVGQVGYDTTNSLNRNNMPSSDKESIDEPPRKKHAPDYWNDGDSNGALIVAQCEVCGNMLEKHRGRYKNPRRFCSVLCAKSQNRNNGDHENGEKEWKSIDTDSKLNHVDSIRKNGEDRSSSVASIDRTRNADDPKMRINPIEWTVDEVCDLVRGLPGCAEYAEDFAIQEIDGQALMLLKENHLMSSMGIKLGPALKIVGTIQSLRLDSNLSPSIPWLNNF